MLKIGRILIDPNSIDTVLEEQGPFPDNQKGYQHIQIVYKSGVVKNFKNTDIGLTYEEFVETLMREAKKAEDRKILRVMTAVNQTTHG